ncbi:hypothetical protein GXB85_04400 [Cellulomonas sp. APG4]|uniref:Gmad2 immunoglobulin-like domain-containing protein n=1 Tax=Cellulomonas sp. APG4 TaxID=1538656 RepID=UPI00137A92F8|nr:Gmad2 immunoglobulin-like domain-containing protein [Cellulomonas sp. APG4]NCT90195.1 hypothetical protein [Cellulomonas sp. APG4]
MSLDRVAPRGLLVLALVVGLSACQTGSDEEPTPEPATQATQTPDDSGTGEDAGDDDATDGAEDDASQDGTVADDVLSNGTTTLTAPASGATVDGPAVTVSGEATAFEGTLNYHVLDAATGDVVVPVDYTTAGANGEVGPWSIDLDLEPGTYRVEVWEPNMAGEGEGSDEDRLNLVAVTFTVS